MAQEKGNMKQADAKKGKNKNDTKIPGFAEYERERLKGMAKQAREAALELKKAGKNIGENILEGTEKKDRERGTLRTLTDVFKEAWQTAGKDFKKVLFYKGAASVLQGLAPYCNKLLFGELPNVAVQASSAIMKITGFAGLEVARQRLQRICNFKGRMAKMVLNDTYQNSVMGRIYQDVLHKPRPYFKDNAPASLSGVANEVASAKNSLLNSSMDWGGSAIVFCISAASMASVSPTLAAGVLGVTVLSAEFGSYMNNAYRKFMNKMRSFNMRISKENSDSIRNTPLVQDTNRVEMESALMQSRLDKSSKINQKTSYARSSSYLKFNTGVSVVMQGLITAASVVDVWNTGDIGRFALINGASWQMLGSGTELSEYWSDIQSTAHKLIDSAKKLKTPKELMREVGEKSLGNEDTKISVRDVTFAYPLIKDLTDKSMIEENHSAEIKRTENILKNVSVEFDKGQLTAVVGTSGHGKSTLMSLIRHDYDVQGGEIFIGNKEIREIKDDELNGHIAFVDQNVHFFDESVAYNLKYFKPNATPEELEEACKKAGFGHDIERFDDGMAHRIGQDGSKLSGGQRQRLALARAFLTDKPIVIMDEPTTGLDQGLSLNVMRGLKELAKEKTVIMVTHNPTEVALADRVVVVQEGQISGDGKPLDLIKSNDFLRKTLTKDDISNKRRLYNTNIHGNNPMQEAAEILNGEASGKVLSDAERADKLKLLEAHKRAYVGVRKNAIKSDRAKEGKPLPEKNGKQPLRPIPAIPTKGGVEI